MADIRLYDTYAGSWFHRTDASAVEVSANFVPLTDATCAEISWYRGSTTSTLKPDRLRLYDRASGSIVVELTTFTDDLAVGWQRTTFTTVELVANRIYQVAAHFPAGGGYVDSGGTVSNVPTYPVTWWTTGRRSFNYSGTVVSGETTNNTSNFGVDVRLTTGPAPAPPDPGPALAGELDNWLSTDPEVQTHEGDGLPWLTKAAVDASRSVLDALSGVVTNIGNAIGDVADAASSTGSLMARVAQILLDTAAILARIPADILNSINELVGWVSSWFGDTARPEGTAPLPTTLNDVWLRALALWHRTETTTWLEAVPGDDWILVDTLDWSGPIGWSQPADCYVIEITSYPDYWDMQDVDGHIWLPRAGSWSPLTGTLPHERRFVDFAQQVLTALPMRCQGILLNPRENFAGTLQAWIRPDPEVG